MVGIKIPNIVVVGGGTGSSVVLKGLKDNNCNLFTIVPMGDSGGSSGKLRAHGVLSAGEIRQRLVALADNSNEFVRILNHRFEQGEELRGHNLGNLLIAGLTEAHNSQEKAIEILSKILNIKGKIIPSTWEMFDLVAEYENGEKIIGEHFIDEKKGRIVKLYTQPMTKANPDAVEAILNADIIIFGPGDLYTSILHNVVVEGIPQAIQASNAKKIFVSNLMTSEETFGMTLQDLIDELEKYIKTKIDIAVVNSKELPKNLIEKCAEIKQFPVRNILSEETKQRIKVVEEDLLAEEIYSKSTSDVLKRSILRHDPNKLGSLLINLIQGA